VEADGRQVLVDPEAILGAACCMCQSEDKVQDGPCTWVEEPKATLGDNNLVDNEGVAMDGSAVLGGKKGGDLVVDLACERPVPLFPMVAAKVGRECAHDLYPQEVREFLDSAWREDTVAARSAACVRTVVRWLKKKTLAKVGEPTRHPNRRYPCTSSTVTGGERGVGLG